MKLVKQLIKYLILKFKFRGKVKFGFNANIGLKSKFEGMNQIHSYTEFTGELGYGSYIANNSKISGQIGRFTSIGPFVRCNQGKHPYKEPYVSTSPCFFSLNPYKAQNGSTFATSQCFDEISYADDQKKYGVIIGNDCWIGEGAFLVGGIKIADGAVVMAHAVVTKDVPPFAIVGGIPARIIDYRYSEEDRRFLLNTKWWNNTSEWFKVNWKLLTDLKEYKKYYNSL